MIGLNEKTFESKKNKENKNFWQKIAIFLISYLAIKIALKMYMPPNKIINFLP